jgi:hypothetical protein
MLVADLDPLSGHQIGTIYQPQFGEAMLSRLTRYLTSDR